jgi:hypothetical protein
LTLLYGIERFLTLSRFTSQTDNEHLQKKHKWQAISFASTTFNNKSLSRQNDHQKMSAKLTAKPLDSCQLHWTKMDKICVAPALQLHEAASQ